MCLAIPGKLIDINNDSGLPMGRVDYAGTIQTACLAYVPDAVPGQYVLVHAGFAISVVDEEEAHRTLALWNEIVEAHAREEGDPFGAPLALSRGDSPKGPAT